MVWEGCISLPVLSQFLVPKMRAVGFWKLMLSIAVPCFNEIHFCQSAEAARESTVNLSLSERWTGHTNLVGKSTTLLKAKAERDIFPELQLTVATAFSLGHQKVKKKNHTSVGFVYGRTSQTIKSSIVNPIWSLIRLIFSPVEHSTQGRTSGIFILCCNWGLTSVSSWLSAKLCRDWGWWVHQQGWNVAANINSPFD